MEQPKAQPTIFGGNTGMTYEGLQQKRKIIDQLMQQAGKAPKNVGEGLNAIGNALLVRSMQKKADKRDAELSGQFNDNFAKAAPNMQGLADMASSPYAGKGHKKVISALMDGAPNYARGTNFHPGGRAVVGENGPEVAILPRGSQVIPAQMDGYDQGGPASDPNYQVPMDGYMQPPEPDEYLREELGDELFQQYQGMNHNQRMDFMNDPANGFVPPAPEDTRELTPQYDAQVQPLGGQGAEYKTAELAGVAGDVALAGGEGEDELPYGDEKMTGEQSKAITYYRRGYGSNQVLNDPKMAESLTQYTDTFAGNFGAVGRKFQDADFQVAHRAASEFLAAILRKDTGAAITSEEFSLYGPMYLPQPGDKPELIAAKKKAREEALIGIEMGLGTVAGLAAQTREELGEGNKISDDDFLKSLGLE